MGGDRTGDQYFGGVVIRWEEIDDWCLMNVSNSRKGPQTVSAYGEQGTRMMVLDAPHRVHGLHSLESVSKYSLTEHSVISFSAIARFTAHKHANNKE